MNFWQKLFWSVAALGALSAILDGLSHPLHTLGILAVFIVAAVIVVQAIKGANG